MSLDKAIKSGKEKRSKRASDKAVRDGDKTHKHRKQELKAEG